MLSVVGAYLLRNHNRPITAAKKPVNDSRLLQAVMLVLNLAANLLRVKMKNDNHISRAIVIKSTASYHDKDRFSLVKMVTAIAARIQLCAPANGRKYRKSSPALGIIFALLAAAMLYGVRWRTGVGTVRNVGQSSETAHLQSTSAGMARLPGDLYRQPHRHRRNHLYAPFGRRRHSVGMPEPNGKPPPRLLNLRLARSSAKAAIAMKAYDDHRHRRKSMTRRHDNPT